MSFAEDDLSQDDFLGGRVRLIQPRRGYRAATDPVFLAAAVAARPGQIVLDIGCGAGAAAACLAARIPGVVLHGLELQPDYAALARRNLPLMEVWEGDLFAPPPALASISFDWVLTNPPFFNEADAASPDQGRDKARREMAPAQDWVAASLRRVRSGGRIAIVHLVERLPEVIAGLSGAGDIAILPLQPRTARQAKRMIVTARKGARGPLRILPPMILHDGPEHVADGEDFSTAAQKILRNGEPLPT